MENYVIMLSPFSHELHSVNFEFIVLIIMLMIEKGWYLSPKDKDLKIGFVNCVTELKLKMKCTRYNALHNDLLKLLRQYIDSDSFSDFDN